MKTKAINGLVCTTAIESEGAMIGLGGTVKFAVMTPIFIPALPPRSR